jgi:16S rRNA (cytidine1402-2'-O)-methyltransferase
MSAVLGAGRRIAVARELTKLYEEVVRGTAAELADWAANGVRGELVLVVEGAPAAQITFPDALAQVRGLVAAGTRLKDAAGEVSAHTGHSSRELYQAALAEKNSRV